MSSNIGRLVVDVQTNQSGGAVAYGDAVILDTAHDDSFTTTTTSGYTGMVGVCIEPNGIAAAATGRIQYGGKCPQINLSASTTRGHYIKTHTVAKQGVDAGASRVIGAFGQTTKTGATPPIMLFGFPDAAASSAAQGTPGLTLGTTNVAGSSGTYVGTDGTIAAFDATVPVTQASSDAAAAGSAGVAARRDHKHGMPAASSYPGYEFDYAQITAGVTISATTQGTSNTIVDGAAVSYDGSTIVMLEFFSPAVSNSGISLGIRIAFYDGATLIDEFGANEALLTTSTLATPVLIRRRYTPTNASHTFHVKAYGTAANGVVNAGVGGAAAYPPAFLRITRV